MKFFVDSLVAFSCAPIQMPSMLGDTVAPAAVVYAGYVLASGARDIPVKGDAPMLILPACRC